jgi:hypothetical protein
MLTEFTLKNGLKVYLSGRVITYEYPTVLEANEDMKTMYEQFTQFGLMKN